MHIARQGIYLSAVCLLSFATLCHAQSTPEDEYKQLIKVNQDIQPLGPNPFGENVSLYDGTLTFEETDLSLPGNGPTIQLGRSFNTNDPTMDGMNVARPFGDWEMDIPRIETATANQRGVYGWQVSTDPTTGRCTHFGPPPPVLALQGTGDEFQPDQWWYGYHLIVPGSGSQELLPRDSVHNTFGPTMSGRTFNIVTKQNWMITCVAADDGNEGFLAIAPNGMQYTFAHLVYRHMAPINVPFGSGGLAVRAANGAQVLAKSTNGGQAPAQPANGVHPMIAQGSILQRRKGLMLVTRIQDRFGNSVSYNYDSQGRLSTITSSDGRSVTVQYMTSTSPLITSVSASATDAGTRTWTYNYDTSTYPNLPSLTGLHLPDQSAWSFSLGAFQWGQVVDVGGNCSADSLAALYTNPTSGTITQPSGLVGTFTTKPTTHGRSYVLKQCYGGASTNEIPVYSTFPQAWYQQSVISKAFSGAGVPAETWSYQYGPINRSWSSDACAGNGSCPSSVYTDVIDPAGHDVRHTFSNRFDASEGKLLRTDAYSGAAGSAILRSDTYSYADRAHPGSWPSNTPWPWPTSYGYDLQDRDNWLQTEQNLPLYQHVISQVGDNYTWLAEKINAYLLVTQTKRSSSITGQAAIEETHYFQNDTNLWVLGLPLQLINVATGAMEWANTYASSNETLLSHSRFGLQLMAYTYKSNGNLASFTDGNSHTTTLDSYKRGIPQAISYPDGTSQSLSVDDFGQIRSITDQASSTTSYSYDAVGRLTGITYPTGDEQSWLPTTFAYDFVTGTERGISGNHWRRTVFHGTARAVTYFDAELRPILGDNFINGVSGSNATTLSYYDPDGRQTFASYPNASALNFGSAPAGTTTAYDALGRVTQTQQSSELGTLSTSLAWLSGARKQVTDPKSNITTTSYQVFDQPVDDAPTKVQAPAGLTQTITRDIYGSPTSITQSGTYGGQNVTETKSLVYDTNHRFCRLYEPESGSTIVAYDGANNVRLRGLGVSGITGSDCGKTEVPLAQQTNYTFDAMNRVLTVQPPSGTQSTVYTYDALGNLKTAQSGLSLWGATYNKRSMMTGETLNVSGAGGTWTLGYVHDTYGHLSVMQYPNGESVSYAPDPLGRPAQVGTYATGIDYFPNGAVAEFTFGSGAAYVAEQNTRQLQSNLSYGKGSTLNVSEDLTYDADANITKFTDLVNNTRDKTLGYDGLDRLISAAAPNLWGTETYTYDPLNNLRTRVFGGQTLTYTYDPNNRLSSLTGTGSFAYDNNGNTISRQGQALVYDGKNQLTQIVGGDSYAYDASGRRVMKTPNGASPTYYFYTHAGQLLYQKNPGSTGTTNFIYLGTKLLARKDTHGGATTTYVYADGQGTPLVEMDASGNVTNAFDYMPYGSQAMGLPQDGPGYTGHVHDAASGLVYMQARYYDPVLGRFLSVDPVQPGAGNAFNFNRYDYANNSPIVNVDPDGWQSVGEMINSGAEGCGPVSCAGYAVLSAAWKLTGAEPVSQLADKGWSNTNTGEKVYAALAVAAVLPVGRVAEGVANVAKAAEGGAKEAVSMSEAVDKAIAHTGSDATVGMTKGGNVQFSKSVTDQSGNTITKNARFDVNPSNAHVQKQGPHLNIETQQNGEVIQNDHISIDPKTLRPGDHGL